MSHHVLASPRLPVIVVPAFFVFQLFVLYSYYAYEIAPFPPDGFDQAVYLTEVYALSQRVQVLGVPYLLSAPFSGLSPQSALFRFEGSIFNLFGGGGRLSVLLLNVSVFVVLQLVIYKTVRQLTQSRLIGIAAVLLLLLQRSMWLPTGGIFDFRIDWLAGCLFGIWLCIILQGDTLLSRKSVWLGALVGSLLVLNRFIAFPYVIVVIGGFVAIHLSFLKSSCARRRTKHGLLLIGLVVLICGPFLFTSWDAIKAYYVVGHLTGSEKAIRAAEVGAVSIADHIKFYPLSILRDHLGPLFGIGCLVYFVTVLGASVWKRLGEPSDNRSSEIVLVLGAIVGPLFILTLNEAKSPVVGGIVNVPIILLVVLLPRWFGVFKADTRRLANPIAQWMFVSGCSILAGVSVFSFLHHSVTARSTTLYPDRQQWAASAVWIAADAQARSMNRPKVFFDTVSSHVYPFVFTAFAYETTRNLIAFEATFGASIFAFEPEAAMRALEKSDYVVLTSGHKKGPFPFFASMNAVEQRVREWTQTHLFRAAEFSFDGQSVTFYAKPFVNLQGVSGDWLPAEGASVTVRPSELKMGARLVLTGKDAYRRYVPNLKTLDASAMIERREIPLSATIRRTNEEYVIVIDLAPIVGVAGGAIPIALRFKDYFVPKEVGINQDTRKLVVWAPNDTRIEVGESSMSQ